LHTALVVSGTDGLVTVSANPVDSLGVATKGYVDGAITTLRDDTSAEILANVATIESELNSIRANATSTNSTLTQVRNNKANIAGPTFTGAPSAPTPTSGDNSTRLATTAFVSSAISIFDPTQIYNGTTNVTANASDIVLTASGVQSATVTSTGITTVTQSQNSNNLFVATTAYADRGDKNFVLNATKYQPTCYVSDQLPDNGVGSDGDFWFQYQ
jgi:hypothetical protein